MTENDIIQAMREEKRKIEARGIGRAPKYYIYPSEVDFLVKRNGQAWVDGCCEIIKPIKGENDD